MDRREFLKFLGIAGLVAVTPVAVAKLEAPNYEFCVETFDFGNQIGAAISMNYRGEIYRHAIRVDCVDFYRNFDKDWRNFTQEKILALYKPKLIEWAEDKREQIDLKLSRIYIA